LDDTRKSSVVSREAQPFVPTEANRDVAANSSTALAPDTIEPMPSLLEARAAIIRALRKFPILAGLGSPVVAPESVSCIPTEANLDAAANSSTALAPDTIETMPSPIAIPSRAVSRTETTSTSRARTIPRCITFFDVETTGFDSKDRIVTLAAVKLLDTNFSPNADFTVEYMHLIFDPGRKSHPKAEAVHGYSDWLLRHQADFIDCAEIIEGFFTSTDLIVAHNAEFDIDFYNREMKRAGRSLISKPVYCTMNSYRQRSLGGSASLNAICQKIGIQRSTKHHGALEDAWLAMRVYFLLNRISFSTQLPPEFTREPSNMKVAPPLPDGPLPRRRRKGQKPTRAVSPLVH
jgi:DNA polymerase III subunit epsilon